MVVIEDDNENPDQPSSTTSRPAPTPTSTAKSSTVKQSLETEDVAHTGSEEHGKGLTPSASGQRERDAFLDWVRWVIHELDRSLWRHCQQEISNTLYKYIEENDQLKKQPESSKGERTSLETSSDVWQKPSQRPSQASVQASETQNVEWVAPQSSRQQQLSSPLEDADWSDSPQSATASVEEMSSSPLPDSPSPIRPSEPQNNQFIVISDLDPDTHHQQHQPEEQFGQNNYWQ